MESIINNQDSLKLSWGPGIKEIKKNWKKPSIPDAILFRINFPKDGKELREAVEKDLDLLNDPEIEVIKYKIEDEIHYKVKDEYKEQHDQLFAEYNVNKKKGAVLLNQLEELGFNLGMSCCSCYLPEPYITGEWLEVDFVERNYNRPIDVKCHKDTKFYKILSDHGILDKYYPEWFAKGAF